QMRNTAPPRAATGNTTRCRAPTKMRARCGIIRPTNPIPPDTATKTPTRIDVKTNNPDRTARTGTPNAAATSGPLANASNHECTPLSKHADIRTAKTDRRIRAQVVPETLHNNQTIPQRPASRLSLKNTRQHETDENAADVTTPLRINR